jgi:threonine dehydrogenase-like Zn-dependent dehydrogenase
MKALRWHGKHDIRCDTVPDPIIEEGRDAIIKVSTCAICGSDLHLFDGFMPTMENGDIMGHEFMGEVVEVGKDNKALQIGNRVVIPFTIFCGECDQCKRGNFSVRERSNRNKEKADKVFWVRSTALRECLASLKVPRWCDALDPPGASRVVQQRRFDDFCTKSDPGSVTRHSEVR